MADQFRLVRFERSRTKNKKYDGIIEDRKTKRTQRVPFGQIGYSQYKDYHALKNQISINQINRTDPHAFNPVRAFTYNESARHTSLRSASSGMGRQVSGGINSQTTPDHQISGVCDSTMGYNNYTTCIICMTNQSDVVLMNCKHSHVCQECFLNIQSSPNQTLFCPTCRSVPAYAINVKKTHLTSRLECPFCVEKNKINDTVTELLPSVNETMEQQDVSTNDINTETNPTTNPIKVAKLPNRAVVMFVKCGCLSSCNECIKELYKGQCLTCGTDSEYVNIFI